MIIAPRQNSILQIRKTTNFAASIGTHLRSTRKRSQIARKHFAWERNLVNYTGIADARVFLGDMDEAIYHLTESISNNPIQFANFWRGLAYQKKGMFKEAADD